jgi:hypothetical protein
MRKDCEMPVLSGGCKIECINFTTPGIGTDVDLAKFALEPRTDTGDEPGLDKKP